MKKTVTKEDYIGMINNFLTGDLTGIDPTLIDTCRMAVSNSELVKKEDLAGLVTEIDSAIREAVKNDKEEKESKKSSKKGEKKPVDKSLKKKKLTGKGDKSDKKEPEASAKKDVTEAMFPKEVKLGDTVLVKTPMTFAEVKEAMDDDNSAIYFAAYWNAKQLKQYYHSTFRVSAPKSFDNDLDIFAPLYSCTNINRIVALSSYTEAVTFFDEYDFEVIKDKTLTGETYEVKVSNGMEFEIYTEKK